MNDPNEMPAGEKTPADPKIIVDSDWKEQVAQEKEKLKTQSQEEASDEVSPAAEPDQAKSDPSPPQSPVSQSPATQPAGGTAPAGPSLPPASFEVLISMLFTQALSALGQMPGPSGKPSDIDKTMAKHTIDTLEMLEVKTNGNLSNEETKMLGEALHALRMTYVSVRG